MNMTPLNMIESLVEKFESINHIFIDHIRSGGLDVDACMILSSGIIVYDEQPSIERAIRVVAELIEHKSLLRQLATEIDQMLVRLTTDKDKIYKMSEEMQMIFDVGIMHETIAILRESLNPNDRDIHEYLTYLAMGNAGIYLKEMEGECVADERMELDKEFQNFFERIETERKRLEYILNFQRCRTWVSRFRMDQFHNTIKSLARVLRNMEIEPYKWSDDDYERNENFFMPNLKEIFAVKNEEMTDVKATEIAAERGHIYFNSAKVSHFHSTFIKEQFHDIEEHHLYAILNLRDCDKSLQIRQGEKNRVYYLISVLASLIQANLRVGWRKSFCEHLGVPEKTYNSKYKEIIDSENSRDMNLKEKAKAMCDYFETLDKAS